MKAGNIEVFMVPIEQGDPDNLLSTIVDFIDDAQKTPVVMVNFMMQFGKTLDFNLVK